MEPSCLNYTERTATQADYIFLFQLKKKTEYDVIEQVFGWYDHIQQDIHAKEWQEGKPTVIEIDGVRAGSYWLNEESDHFYLGRFYILPEFQNKGLGSRILKQCIAIANGKKKPIKLCYLVNNKVGALYRRYGFQEVSKDQHFFYMTYVSHCDSK
ncbi:GNAT family N-acetyltransferase [Vibrio sonorensis]|uniref:GNAT family N-acetyltransferase n=1 Tax=Vibrio sonorensis TaxID=1004316 RepID=UPI0008D8EEF3|nr:GNAT family N-acetyltransferase [Vibrio sonorensis]